MASKASRKIYQSKAWQWTRDEAIARAGYRCEVERCGSFGIRGGRLEVHHRIRLCDGGAPFDLANLRVLCRACHFKEHRQKYKPLAAEARAERNRMRELAASLIRK